jgi:Flp pilus assembly protein CpaB
MAAHLPVAGSQNWPAAQLTPLHATAKHPATQSPSTQVCPWGHVLPAHGSLTRTQVARQVLPAAQVPAGALAHGSG